MTHRRIEGDCLEVMRDLPRGHYDLLLTDPPYAMPAKYYAGVIGKRRWSDTSIMTGWWRVVMERVVPLLKESSSMAVFCNADSMAVFWPLLYEVASHNHLVVWSKGGGGTGYPFMGRHELIAVAVLGKGAQPRPRGGTWDVGRDRVPYRAAEQEGTSGAEAARPADCAGSPAMPGGRAGAGPVRRLAQHGGCVRARSALSARLLSGARSSPCLMIKRRCSERPDRRD